MNDQDMKREVIVAFEYSYLHDSWVNPLEEALEGVTAEQALWKPGPESKGIWEIVLHWTVWGDNIVERIETGKPTRPREEDWPPLPAVTDEAAWEEAKNRLRASLDSIRRTIENTPLDTIQAGPYGLGDLFCRFLHNAYHLGQITKLRECAGFN